MIVGVPSETAPGERRVALVPEAVKALVAAGREVVVQAGAGREAGFSDDAYGAAGARIANSGAELFGSADVVLKVQPPQPRPGGGHEVDDLREGSALIAFLKPFDLPDLAERLARRKVDAFSVELMPRITRAQSMDALSSQSTISGYRAVLLAATSLPRIFPMLVTAAGTLQPARLLVIGAGVAGLQALGTGKRLGAMTFAYDTRAAVKEQVESMGARFVELDLDTGDSEDAGGYARAQSEEFYARQREQLGKHVAQSDAVVTTALVPGKPAPRLIDESAVEQMRLGSVIVDLAAERGGNCACTRPGEVADVHGVTIIGYTNLPAQVPAHASQMYAKNLTTFLDHLAPEDGLQIDLEDEITRGTLLTHGGEVIHEVVKEKAASASSGAVG